MGGGQTKTPCGKRSSPNHFEAKIMACLCWIKSYELHLVLGTMCCVLRTTCRYLRNEATTRYVPFYLGGKTPNSSHVRTLSHLLLLELPAYRRLQTNPYCYCRLCVRAHVLLRTALTTPSPPAVLATTPII